jgi:hypothetical protein
MGMNLQLTILESLILQNLKEGERLQPTSVN